MLVCFFTFLFYLSIGNIVYTNTIPKIGFLHMDSLPPVTPILRNTAQDILEDQEAVIWQIIEFAFENPGDTSDSSENELISFRKIQAQFDANIEGMASAFSDKLQDVINQYYPNDSINVNIDAEPNDDDDTIYTLKIIVSKDDGSLRLSLNPITIEKSAQSISIDYSRINR